MHTSSLRAATLAALVALGGRPALAQSVVSDSAAPAPQKTFFTRRDLAWSAAALVGSAVVSIFDARIANYAQQPAVQGSAARQDLVKSFTMANETPLTLLAAATYGVGRLTGNATIADVGLHTTEALVLTVAVSELLRAPIGRLRPGAAGSDAYQFEANAGFTKFENRSFPSLHSSAAFAAAAALSGEIGERRPDLARYVTPALYGAALIPPLTRIYLNEHWASDVVAGAFVGGLLGSRVVSYAHSHDRNWIDRHLLGASLMPDGAGGLSVALSVAP